MTTNLLNAPSAAVVLREEATVVLEELELTITGSVIFNTETHRLAITDSENGGQPWSVTLDVEALPANTAVIKDYTEFQGLAGALAEIGVVEILGETFSGPYRSHCFIVRVLPAA